MKIIRLQSTNVMRLTAIDVTPEGHVVVVGGRNGAGKSSVLDSIAMALGGLALAPTEPIRAGEPEARIVVDLDDLRVTRRFARDRIGCDCGQRGEQDLETHASDCGIREGRFGETRSTLTVTSPDGFASYRTPQAMLDKLLGKLTFDPLAFARMPEKERADTLRRLVGLDTTEIEARRLAAFQRRAMLKKQHEAKAAVAGAMPLHADAPTAEIPMAEISAEMLRAEELRRTADDAERAIDRAQSTLNAHTNARVALKVRIEEMERTLMAVKKEVKAVAEDEEKAAGEVEGHRITAEAARAAVPDAAGIRARLAEAEAQNARVRANAARRAAQAEAARLKADADVQHAIVVAADGERQAAIAAARFPVDGLGLTEDGVTFGDLPFSQASSSEQLRVSVAIGLALNPTLRVLLIRSGNLLDPDSFAALAAQAEAADAQVWIEWVTKDAGGVSVMIEEGHVIAQQEVQDEA